MTIKTAKIKPDDITQAYAGDILKFDRTADGLMVDGIASSPRIDLDEQIADPEWLKGAMPDWFRWSNVRGMHGSIAAGVGKELTHGDGDMWGLKALVVDEDSAKKVETGVYKGFSIGIKGAKVIRDAKAKGGRIVGGTIVEVSLVDRPCNPDAVLSIAKAEGAALAPVDGAGVVLAKFEDGDEDVTVGQPPEPAGPKLYDERRPGLDPDPPADEPLSDDDQMAADAVAKAAQSAALAPEVLAKVTAEVDSVSAATPGPAAVLAPSAYRKAAATVAGVLSGDIVKGTVDESGDIAGATAVLGQLADLIISEATELKGGRVEEAWDIACLMEAVMAVKRFLHGEQDQDGTDTPDAAPAMSYVQLAADGETAKSATVTPEDTTTAVVPDVTELVKAAVAEATRASEDRYKAIEAELAKVRAMPIPGGPMILPPAGTGAPAQTSPEQTLVKRYRLMAEQAGDPAVQRAYRDLAESIAKT